MPDNDEYHFSDPNVVSDTTTGDATHVNTDDIPTPTAPPYKAAHPHMKRNAMIAIGVFLLVMMLYSLLTKIFKNHAIMHPMSDVAVVRDKADNKTLVSETTTKIPSISSSTPVIKQQPLASQPSAVSSTEVNPVPVNPLVADQPISTLDTPPVKMPADTMPLDHGQMNVAPGAVDATSNLSLVEKNQDRMKDELSALHDQMATMSANVDLMMTKMTETNQQLLTMATQMSEEAARFEQKIKQASMKKRVMHKHALPKKVYYIQAVIPGRAWLVTEEGSTKTVRVGTSVPGYGVIQHIDARQGIILTSSGKLIRFSQDDS